MRSAWLMTPAVGLVAAREPGQDRQAGGVGGGPALGPQRVGAQVPHRAAVGVPARALARGGVELEELAVALAQREHVAVAAALDRRVGRDRVGAGIGLVGARRRRSARAAVRTAR